MDSEINDIIEYSEAVLQVKFETEISDLLKKYMHLLLEWNKKINLISRKSEIAVLKDGLIESFSLYEVLSQFSEESNIIDIGSGGGIPAMFLAIFLPDCHFTLVDSTQKKTMVLSDIKENLGLSNVTIITGRLEELARKNEGQFDFAISRGVGKFDRYLEFYHTIIDDLGIIFFLTGDNYAKDKVFKEANIIENPYIDDRIIVSIEKQ